MRKVLVLLVVALCFSSEAGKLKKESTKDQRITAEYAVLMDYETGDCLFSQKGEERCVPSSMTKLMTIYLLFSEIAAGRIKLDDEFPVSAFAQKMRGSRSFFQAGTTARVDDLIRSIVVHSGNDACVIVAEAISGDVEVFAEVMNEKAREFGLKNTHFVNPTGLPDEEHFSCAYDLAILCKRIISDFPQFYHYFSEEDFTVNSITQQNRNTLLGNSLGVDGLKTGKTDSGGYGIAASAEKDGRRLIVVVNGCKSAKARAQDANKLLALGFGTFVPVKIATAGKPIVEISVWLGKKDRIGLCTHEDIVASIPKKYEKLLKVETIFKEPMEAPIVLGTQVGELVYKYENVTSPRYALFPTESVERTGFIRRAQLSLKHLIFGNEPGRKNVATSVDNKADLRKK